MAMDTYYLAYYCSIYTDMMGIVEHALCYVLYLCTYYCSFFILCSHVCVPRKSCFLGGYSIIFASTVKVSRGLIFP